GTIQKTTNGGTNWTAQTSSTTSTLYWIKMVNTSTGYACGSSGRVVKTTNGGTNWETLTTPYTATHYKSDWVDANNGIVVGSSGYTIRTTNGGTSWTLEQTSGSTTYGIHMNSSDPDSAWACGSIQGIYKWAAAPQGIAEWKNEVPATYYINQNYPNPFNPTTTIKFGIPKAGNVTLNVYDITGRLVQTLVNNAPLNAGTVTYTFNGSNLASGVYFYSLIVDNNKIDTKKMVLVK
ncbi:T9SS type A sorting domain-containing protein, partial [bacterium BMS3Abin03]|nr:T9SS type A sorting domain-containing protein [bacterium BMS3Abin03]